jgi:hypothetical protein
LFNSNKDRRINDALRLNDYDEDGQSGCCDHPDCLEDGVYKAPKSRLQLRNYHYFCLEHVREYNKAWNYHKGLNEQQVENSIRRSTTWERPSWPFGTTRKMFESFVKGNVTDNFDFFETDSCSRDKEAPSKKFNADQLDALDIMGLKPPIDISKLKSQYKYLVKIHHPDRNGGDRKAEERLKLINEAYTTLKQFLS